MDSSRKISVCIPFYNLEAFVGRCLDSVIGNTYQNLEIICVNDGSTDKTSELLHRYAQEDARIIVIDKANGGVVSARGAALHAATGDFISFIDGDDWVHCKFFEALISAQAQSGADVVVCGHFNVSHAVADAEVDLSTLSPQCFGLDKVFSMRDVRDLVWGRIYSAKLTPKLAVDRNISIGEDTIQNILFLCSSDTTKIATIPDKLYYYYQRENSLVHTLPHRDKIKVCDYFVKHAVSFTTHYGKRIVLQTILSGLLSYRYLEMYSEYYQDIRRHCKELYVFCKKSWKNVLSSKERLKYQLLYYCPFVYRRFRIATDPTMLDWERAQKARRKELQHV